MDIEIPFLKIFKYRSFIYLWLAQVISQIAGNILNFVLLLRIAQLGNSNTLNSLFVISISLPAFLFGGIAGVYVERVEKKNVMFICNLLRAVCVLGFILSSETIATIFFLAVFISIVAQFFVPAEASLIPRYVPKQMLLTANGLFTFTFYSSVIIGFMFAGPFISMFGLHNTFYITSILFIFATLLVSFLPGSNSWKYLSKVFSPHLSWFKFELKIVDRTRNTLFDLHEAYSYLRNHERIFQAIVIMAVVQVLIATMSAIAPGYASYVLKIKITDASMYIIAPSVVGMIVGSILVGFVGNKLSSEKLITWGVVLSGVFLTILSFFSRGKYSEFFSLGNNFLGIDILHLAVIFLFGLGLTSALISVSANTIMQGAEEHLRSRMYGFLTAIAGLGSVFPVIAAGVLSDLIGVVKVMFLMGVGILSFSLLKIAKNFNVR